MAFCVSSGSISITLLFLGREDALYITRFGVPIVLSVSLNKFDTLSALLESHLYVSALISFFKFSILATFLAAKITFIFSKAHKRANEALRPEPAPTIKTDLFIII